MKAILGSLTRVRVLFAALLLVAVGSFAIAGGVGGFKRGAVTPGAAVSWRVLNRATHYASLDLQDFAKEMFRTAAGTYQSGCLSNGGLVKAAATGFNVEITAGMCFHQNTTGAGAGESAFRVLQWDADTTATSWAVAQATDIYYVHVAYADSISSGVMTPSPTILVNTSASAAGYYTLASVDVDITDPDASAYTITDSRVQLNGTHHMPGAVAITGDVALGELAVSGDIDMEDDKDIIFNSGDTVTMGYDLGTGDLDMTANLDITGTLDASGAFSSAAATVASLDVSAGGIIQAGAISGAKTYAGASIDLTGGGIDLDDGQVINFASLGGVTMGYTLGTGTLDIAADINLTGDFDLSGEVQMASGKSIFLDTGGSQSLTWDAATSKIDIVGDVEVTGAIEVTVPTPSGTDLFAPYSTVHATLDCTGGTACDVLASPVSFGPQLPDNTYATMCWYEVSTTFVSNVGGNLAQIGLGIVSDFSDGIIAPVAINVGTTWDAVNNTIPTIVDGQVANHSTKTTAARYFEATIAVEDVDSGVLELVCQVWTGYP